MASRPSSAVDILDIVYDHLASGHYCMSKEIKNDLNLDVYKI